MQNATPDYSRWIGRQETAHDEITASPVAALSAMLDREPARPAAGTPLPLLAHWLYFLPLHRQSTLGEDGHTERGGFLPPVDLPRRMWAASRFRFVAPLRIGSRATRTSRIESITPKQGRSGPLVFVTVSHRIAVDDALAIEEEHEIVFRGPPPAEPAPAPQAAPAPAPQAASDRPAPGEAPSAQWRVAIQPDPVLLFRFSALTFNSHRIHYDRRYVTTVEGYPGLVVHGPLMGLLLVDALAARVPAERIARYAFRALHPVFDTAPFFVCGRLDGPAAALWIEDATGRTCMSASAALT